MLLGTQREFCCAGCEAVARTIVDGGFEAYYRTRTEAAATPQPRPAAELPNTGKAALILEGVRCAACLWLIEQVLARHAGITRAAVNYTTQRAQLSWDPEATSLAAITEAIRAVGYDAALYTPERQDTQRRGERRAALWRLFVAGFGAMQVMMYAFPAYVTNGELSDEATTLLRWASLVLTTPVILFACRPFFAGARRELGAGRVGLDTPIALGLAGAFVASAWATLTGSGDVYFDSISMLAFLLLGARYAELVARQKASSALDRLMRWVPGAALKPGELVNVGPGERVPADGIVESGASSADESLLTGESRPVPKRAGDPLIAGSVNLDQPLALRVTRVGDDTQAAAIARLAERAGAARPRLVELADRIGARLTIVVLVAAALGAWYWADLWIAVAVLVVTCPCALGLAAPIVLTRANGTLLALGALVTRSSAHAALERVTDVVFDKTGTLTVGHPAVARVTLLGAEDEATCLEIAAALEAMSRHPLARAFRATFGVTVDEARHHAGEGVEGRIRGKRYRIGSRSFCGELCNKDSGSVPEFGVFLASEQGWLAAFEVRDALRPGSADVVSELKARGVHVHLASGDDPVIAGELAGELGIAIWQGAMRPQAKHDYVKELQAEGRVVAVVGDGLNDTPVLAAADVSLAMASGADAAQLEADIVLQRLGALTRCFEVSRRAMRLVRENFAWALAYNALALPAAALGLIGPWEAALGMGASSFVVMLNASRRLLPKETWKASTSSSRSPSLSYS